MVWIWYTESRGVVVIIRTIDLSSSCISGAFNFRYDRIINIIPERNLHEASNLDILCKLISYEISESLIVYRSTKRDNFYEHFLDSFRRIMNRNIVRKLSKNPKQSEMYFLLDLLHSIFIVEKTLLHLCLKFFWKKGKYECSEYQSDWLGSELWFGNQSLGNSTSFS